MFIRRASTHLCDPAPSIFLRARFLSMVALVQLRNGNCAFAFASQPAFQMCGKRDESISHNSKATMEMPPAIQQSKRNSRTIGILVLRNIGSQLFRLLAQLNLRPCGENEQHRAGSHWRDVVWRFRYHDMRIRPAETKRAESSPASYVPRCFPFDGLLR
ncbi:MAG TPA: hypothetical protein VFQ91_16675 [Bryobacteraceae bacterium]|nr:hypothetical protein [Bryobacteraceae bacterium]